MIHSTDLAFLRCIARSGSLAAAARQLELSPPAVTQRLHKLEHALGQRLAQRSGRRLELSADAQWLLAEGEAALQALQSLQDGWQARAHPDAGPLRIAAPLGFGRLHVVPAISALLLRWPQIRPSLHLSDRLDQLPAAGCDLVVQVGPAPLLDWVMHPLAANCRVLCAAPAWLARHGPVLHPHDLETLPCIALRENDEDVTLWRFAHQDSGAVTSQRIRPALASNDGEAVRQWGLAGIGAFVRSHWHVAADLQSGHLVALLPGWRLPDAPISAYTPPRSHATQRARHLIDVLRAQLATAGLAS